MNALKEGRYAQLPPTPRLQHREIPPLLSPRHSTASTHFKTQEGFSGVSHNVQSPVMSQKRSERPDQAEGSRATSADFEARDNKRQRVGRHHGAIPHESAQLHDTSSTIPGQQSRRGDSLWSLRGELSSEKEYPEPPPPYPDYPDNPDHGFQNPWAEADSIVRFPTDSILTSKLRD